ncbi:MAG: DUF882 domain-containing protein [Proteobacteria bacterium]|nr:DUF882 domain-containing protein [Pseudomonadota bacterium]
MRTFVLSFAAALAFAGAAYGQTAATGAAVVTPKKTTTTTAPAKTTVHKPATPVHKTAAVQVVHPPATHHAQAAKPATKTATTPQSLRGSRYGGFAPSAPLPAPDLDTTSPRSLSLLNVNTKEELTVTYWADGTYRRDALDQLNHFLRDSQNNQQTEMDPMVFDVLWHTMNVTGYHGTVEVLSAYRSPETNAWLASVSRGVARDSQHMNGNAMDIRFPGVPVFKIRQAARSLQMGGVGFYPRSGFVHLDTGPIRYW